MINYVDVAVDKAGSVKDLALSLGVTTQFIYRARARGWLPPDRAAQVEDMFGIEREKLVKPALRTFIMGE